MALSLEYRLAQKSVNRSGGNTGPHFFFSEISSNILRIYPFLDMSQRVSEDELPGTLPVPEYGEPGGSDGGEEENSDREADRCSPGGLSSLYEPRNAGEQSPPPMARRQRFTERISEAIHRIGKRARSEPTYGHGIDELVTQPDLHDYLHQFGLSDFQKIAMCRTYASYLSAQGRTAPERRYLKKKE